MTAVHQLVPSLASGDAVGAATVGTLHVLRELGYRSTIFAASIDPRLADVAVHANEMESSVRPGDVVIYRLAIGSHLAARFEKLDAQKVIVYHNITPAEYYAGANPEVAYWLERGREDLHRLAPLCEFVIGDSSYNLAEALQAGARDGVVIPPAIDLRRLAPQPARGSTPPRIFFVGRVAPNKRHDVLIRAIAALRATTDIDAQLVMAGAAADTDRYLRRLGDFAATLGVASAITLDGHRLTDERLADHYTQADVFATASEHEGFCVPAVEAMAYSLPLVAYAAGAVPETVGRAGLLLHTHDPLVWARALERVLTDDALRCSLVEAGRTRVADFSAEKYRGRLSTALHAHGIRP
jgi:glycosyltransferase involved in cell wall biosynthesis